MFSHPVQCLIGAPPADLNAHSVVINSDSRTQIHGWWCPLEKNRPVILLLSGIRANRLSMIGRARFLNRAGFSVLLIDFQATGESKGDAITFGWRESRDVIAAADFVRLTNPQGKIGIIGTSLGGAAALLAVPPLKVDAMALEAVYPTIDIATRNRTNNYLGPFGGFFARLLLWQLHLRLGISPNELRPVDHIADVGCPVLIISGEKDRNTRVKDTQMLFDAARAQKQLWLLPNAGHVDLYQAAPAEYESRVLDFFRQALQANNAG